MKAILCVLLVLSIATAHYTVSFWRDDQCTVTTDVVFDDLELNECKNIAEVLHADNASLIITKVSNNVYQGTFYTDFKVDNGLIVDKYEDVSDCSGDADLVWTIGTVCTEVDIGKGDVGYATVTAPENPSSGTSSLIQSTFILFVSLLTAYVYE